MMVTPPAKTAHVLPRIAVVGCGAAAREYCWPVLSKFAGFHDAVVAVDVVLDQAKSTADEFGVRHYCDDFRCLPFEVDAAIVTTPHRFHADQSIHFLRRGKSVLVEKPLGMTVAEVTEMLAAAESGAATLMVNNCRRLFPSYIAVGEILRSKKYGRVLSIDISDGTEFAWNSVSAFYLRDATSARGVLLDRGAHTIDVLCWWLSGAPRVVEASFDAAGGAEAVMDVLLQHHGAPLRLKFSRLYKLRNVYSIECESARIRGRLFDAAKFEVERNGKRDVISAGTADVYQAYGWRLVTNFVRVVQGREAPLFTAAEVAPSITVIEQAYQQAKPFAQPWYDDDPNLALWKAGQAAEGY